MDFGSAIAAVVETTFKLVKLTFGGVADAGAAAFDPKLDGTHQRKRVRNACLKLFLPACVLAAIAWWTFADYQERHRRLLTESLAAEYADELHQQRNDNGLYRQMQSSRNDAWQRRFRIVYERHPVHQTLTVTSAGNDGQFDTRDDIAANRQHLLGKQIVKEIGKAVGNKVKRQFDGRDDGAP